MLYGYSSRGELTPPDSFTSTRQRLRVSNWLYMGSSASETGSDEIISEYTRP